MSEIYHQSVFEPWPLADNSVQAIITSPPYWGLRKYAIPDVVIGGRPDCAHEFSETTLPKGNGDNKGNRRDRKVGIKRGLRQPGVCDRCGAFKGQYGLEPSFKLFIEHTLLWAKEARRVLKKNGVFFLNLGDTYAGFWGDKYSHKPFGKDRSPDSSSVPNKKTPDWKALKVRPKTKLLIPQRIAISLIDEGWICRNDIVWHKPNSMPESVMDRFSKKFEYIFMLSRSERYFFNLNAVREVHAETTLQRAQRGRQGIGIPENAMPDGHKENTPWPGQLGVGGKNPGDLWSIPVQPSPEEHYAMWPEKLVERMVLCSTRPGDVVLDPFAGSGTTLRVADRLNRNAVGIDLGYKDIQERRTRGIQKELAIHP